MEQNMIFGLVLGQLAVLKILTGLKPQGTRMECLPWLIIGVKYYSHIWFFTVATNELCIMLEKCERSDLNGFLLK